MRKSETLFVYVLVVTGSLLYVCSGVVCQAELEEKREMKRLVLDYEQRQEQEEYSSEYSLLIWSVVMSCHCLHVMGPVQIYPGSHQSKWFPLNFGYHDIMRRFM